MSVVLNRVTKQLIRSANTPDYPPGQWIINPDLSAVDGFDSRYWLITGNIVSLLNQAARDAIDLTNAEAAKDGLVADKPPLLAALIQALNDGSFVTASDYPENQIDSILRAAI